VGLGAAAYSGAAGDRDPLGWWAERNRKPLVEKNFKGSIFSVQGLQDWNVDPHMVIPWVDSMNKAGTPTKQLLGQWDHAYPDMPVKIQRNGATPTTNPVIRFDYAEILLHWFDKYLKGLPVDTGPAVQVMDASGHWRNEATYPPRDANWSTLFLSGSGALTPQPGTAGSALLMPNPLGETLGPYARSMPGQYADFSTAPAPTDTRIAGLPRLHVTVTPKGAAGHLAAWLYDVDPSSKETMIGWTQMNLAFADGTEKARQVTPNMPILAKMEFEPMDALVQAGHRIKLRVWEYQQSDRLPTLPPEPVELDYGGSVKSTLELPTIVRGPNAFFEPPMPPK
jgi:predicted acyl esterase